LPNIKPKQKPRIFPHIYNTAFLKIELLRLKARV
jgi:hypothetical protein